MLDFYLKRWDDNETKVSRFVTMLLALLGAGAFCFWLQCYGLFAICALVSFTFYLWSYYYREFRGPSADETLMLPFFENQKYVDVLVGLSKAYLTAAMTAEACNRTVQRAAHRGYLWFMGAVFFGLLTALGYAIIDREIQHAGRTEVSAAPATRSAPSSAGRSVH
jgi:Ca2+/Na+ antiporter